MEKHYKPKKQKKDENPFEDQPLFKPPTLDVNIGELDPQMAYMRDYHQQIVSQLQKKEQADSLKISNNFVSPFYPELNLEQQNQSQTQLST